MKFVREDPLEVAEAMDDSGRRACVVAAVELVGVLLRLRTVAGERGREGNHHGREKERARGCVAALAGPGHRGSEAGRVEVACAWPAGGEHAPLSFCPRSKTTGQWWWARLPATVLGLLVGAR